MRVSKIVIRHIKHKHAGIYQPHHNMLFPYLYTTHALWHWEYLIYLQAFFAICVVGEKSNQWGCFVISCNIVTSVLRIYPCHLLLLWNVLLHHRSKLWGREPFTSLHLMGPLYQMDHYILWQGNSKFVLRNDCLKILWIMKSLECLLL